MALSKHIRRTALMGLCVTAALASACASDTWSGRRSAMGSTTGTGAMGATGMGGDYTPTVPSPTGATAPMDRTPNATGGTPSGTEGAGAY